MSRSRSLTSLVAAWLALGALTGCGGGEAATSGPREEARGPQRLARVAGVGDALYVTAAPGRRSLFVVQQSGRILRLEHGRVAGTFLDVSRQVSDGGEQGLLGLAFHPGYADNGRLFVDYTDRAGDTRVVEYTANADRLSVDPATAREILRVDQPYANHNGGMVTFGPDGKLYIGLGDGGSGGDPEDRAQDLSTLLGKILRIDVDAGSPYTVPPDNPFRSTPGARPEIWHLGVRNPWRFSFDRATGDMWIGDVGQNAVEEIDFVPAGRGGVNLGWNAFEGRSAFGGRLREGTVHTPPVFQYTHAQGGISVTGGYVYRGSAVPALRGRYVFADYGAGTVWTMAAGPTPRGARRERGLGVKLSEVKSFGEGSAGELYVIANRSLYRFVR